MINIDLKEITPQRDENLRSEVAILRMELQRKTKELEEWKKLNKHLEKYSDRNSLPEMIKRAANLDKMETLLNAKIESVNEKLNDSVQGLELMYGKLIVTLIEKYHLPEDEVWETLDNFYMQWKATERTSLKITKEKFHEYLQKRVKLLDGLINVSEDTKKEIAEIKRRIEGVELIINKAEEMKK